MSDLESEHFRIAMDAIEALEKTSSPKEVVETVERAVAKFGFEHFCCFMPRTLQRPTFDACVMVTRWPDGWFEHYRHSDFQLNDPIVRHTRTQFRATTWSEAPIAPDDHIGRSIMEIAAVDYNLRAGISVPIHGISSYQAGVSFAGREIDISKEAHSAVELIAIYAFNRLNHFQLCTSQRQPLLTPRQREILGWAAKGKTAWDTGQILGISQETVVKITKAAIARLNAANRTHAVVEALLRKEIEI